MGDRDKRRETSNESEANDHDRLLELIKIKYYIEEHSLNRIQREYGDNILSSIFSSHKSFANALFKEVDIC